MGDVPLRIGQLAKSTGVSVDTIRHYERLGLLPKAARTNAGYRQYPPAAADRVRLVRHALRFGFSLRDVAGFLRVRESGGTPCRDVRAAAKRIMTAVDQRIAELTAARKDMSRRSGRGTVVWPARPTIGRHGCWNHWEPSPTIFRLGLRCRI